MPRHSQIRFNAEYIHSSFPQNIVQGQAWVIGRVLRYTHTNRIVKPDNCYATMAHPHSLVKYNTLSYDSTIFGSRHFIEIDASLGFAHLSVQLTMTLGAALFIGTGIVGRLRFGIRE
ncbi:hypothetical protein ccbrp13_63480 [Ktedonobacteria bacterium brp13]|nr:hypothetical protein ccbrp13_63480 [Ktedonobacteria bacterium brp13]